ncbi:unnamed protein product [Peniophora sp. CBMAI 1063]|nr:unnamed protein product [Peniophora sp. CBMAI 1063]
MSHILPEQSAETPHVITSDELQEADEAVPVYETVMAGSEDAVGDEIVQLPGVQGIGEEQDDGREQEAPVDDRSIVEEPAAGVGNETQRRSQPLLRADPALETEVFGELRSDAVALESAPVERANSTRRFFISSESDDDDDDDDDISQTVTAGDNTQKNSVASVPEDETSPVQLPADFELDPAVGEGNIADNRVESPTPHKTEPEIHLEREGVAHDKGNDNNAEAAKDAEAQSQPDTKSKAPRPPPRKGSESHPYLPSPPDQEGNDKIWKEYLNSVAAEDKVLVDGWNQSAKQTLIFVGLFAAVVGRFAVFGAKALSPNANAESKIAGLLAELYLLETQAKILANLTNGIVNPTANLTHSTDLTLELDRLANITTYESQTFVPSQTDIIATTLWHISLVLALFCGIGASLMGDWSLRYASAVRPERHWRTIEDQALHHLNVRVNSSERYGQPALPLILRTVFHVSMVLFYAGLAIYMYPSSHLSVTVTTIAAGFIGVLYVLTVQLELFTARKTRPMARRTGHTARRYDHPAARPKSESRADRDAKGSDATETRADISEGQQSSNERHEAKSEADALPPAPSSVLDTVSSGARALARERASTPGPELPWLFRLSMLFMSEKERRDMERENEYVLSILRELEEESPAAVPSAQPAQTARSSPPKAPERKEVASPVQAQLPSAPPVEEERPEEVQTEVKPAEVPWWHDAVARFAAVEGKDDMEWDFVSEALRMQNAYAINITGSKVLGDVGASCVPAGDPGPSSVASKLAAMRTMKAREAKEAKKAKRECKLRRREEKREKKEKESPTVEEATHADIKGKGKETANVYRHTSTREDLPEDGLSE